MKFRLVDEISFPAKVTVKVPHPDKPGETNDQSFTMRFRAMPISEARKLDAELRAIDDADERATQENDFLKRICVGWDDGVVDADGTPVPFSQDVLDLALDWPFFQVAVFEAYRKALGADTARLGN